MGIETVDRQKVLEDELKNDSKNGDVEQIEFLVCINGSPDSGRIIPYAQALANGLDGRIRLVHVMQVEAPITDPIDPVAWKLRCRDAEQSLLTLSRDYAKGDHTLDYNIIEGQSAEQILRFGRQYRNTVLVFYRQETATPGRIGDTAQRVLASAAGSFFIVPEISRRMTDDGYRRILVPLDGSARAETALPMASKIARHYNAELLLVHATPNVELTEIGPPDSEAIALKERLQLHNRRIANNYLERLRQQLSTQRIISSKHVLTGADARRELLSVISTLDCDLVVLASHGISAHSDVSSGDMANFLIGRSPVPSLMIRRELPGYQAKKSMEQHGIDARLPTGAA